MKTLDRFLQKWRAAKARPYIRRGDDVLDIGCHEGEFLSSLAGYAGRRVGYDPLAPSSPSSPSSPVGVGQEGAAPAPGALELIADRFHTPSPYPDGSFDVIVMLATLEHIVEKGPLAVEFARLLRPQGRVIVTVPCTLVDRVIDGLRAVRLVDGMSLEEHHGYDPLMTPTVFAPPQFHLHRHTRFQLGLNHLFVFEKP